MSVLGMALNDRDQAYVTDNFVTLAEACRNRSYSEGDIRVLMVAAKLPLPSYVLPDETPMVPPDYFQLLDDAGSLEAMQPLFRQRLAAAAQSEGVPMDEDAIESAWFGYLQGHFGVCLRSATPENIALKSRLTARIQECQRAPAPAKQEWRDRLRASVEQLAAIEREFAEHDCARFGRRPSRYMYIDAVRESFPELFSATGVH